MNIVYTARRSLIGGHVAGTQYAAAFACTSIVKRREVVKSVQRSLSGATETLYHRGDNAWQVQFSPVNGASLLALLEFLDSTESGDSFTATLNGDANPTVGVRRTDNGYTLTMASELGSPTTDYFTATIDVVQSP